MTAAAPVRRSRCAGAAAVAALVLLCALSARADVFCTWNGSGYTCSGEGNAVRVIGGGDGWQGDIIVTNIVGTCTNCVAMSPEYVRNWKFEAVDKIGSECEYNCLNILRECEWLRGELTPYTYSCELSPWYGSVYPKYTSSGRLELTNFLHSVGALPGDVPSNRAAALTQQGYDMTDSQIVYHRYPGAVAFYDGAASAYNSFASTANDALASVENIESSTTNVLSGLRGLASMIEELSEEQCTAQWDGGSGGSGGDSGGGSSVVTNQLSGNWCTYEQGEAIKELLDDIKEWSRKQANYLNAISNRVVSIDETIKNALFTSYTHIPTEEELQSSWQELYLTGSNPNFPGYASTNIVARIELLLAGISGVLTNVSDYASQDEFADESLDNTNLVENAMGDFTNQFLNVMQGRAASSRSVGDALVRLYQKFRTWSGTPFSTEFIINSYSVEFESGKALDVPGFAPPATSLPWANLIRVVCRSAMSVVWIFMTVAVFVRFQIAFFQWCFKYVKWAVEVLQGLFV